MPIIIKTKNDNREITQIVAKTIEASSEREAVSASIEDDVLRTI